MITLLAVIYILLTVAASSIVRAETDGRMHNVRTYQWSVKIVSLGVAFLCPFYLLGFIELVFGWPVVSIAKALLVQILGVTALWFYAGKPAILPRSPNIPNLRSMDLGYPIGILSIFVIAALSAISLLLALGFPQGYEVGAYHLPIAVHIFRDGTLLPWDQAFMHTFPANMSILAGFLLQVLPERLVSLANIPFLLLLSYIVYLTARSAKASPASSLLVAIGLTTIPIVAFSSFQVAADLAAVCFLALAVLICITAPQTSRYWPLAVGIAAGLSVGFKSLHLVGCLYLGLLIIWQVGKVERASGVATAFAVVGRSVSLYVGGFLITASFWLARNWVELGNPVYPVHLGPIFDALGWARAADVDYLSRSLMQYEWVRSEWEWLLYPWIEWHYIDQNFKHSSGVGAFFAASFPVALGVAGYDLLSRLGSKKSRQIEIGAFIGSILFLGSIFHILAWWLLEDRQPRYLLGGIVLGLPLVAKMLDDVGDRYKRYVRIVLVVSAILMWFVIFTKVSADAGARFLKKQYTRAGFYEYPMAIDNLPRGSVILNLGGRSLNYSLLGEGLSNRVLGHYIANQVTDENGFLIEGELAARNVTHIYSFGPTQLSPGGCSKLAPIATLPTNREPRILYKFAACDDQN